MAPIIDFKGRGAVEAEARAWIVQLDGRPPSKHDLDALREWVGRSPLHAACLREQAELWSELDCLTELYDAIEEVRTQASRRSPGRVAFGGGLAVATFAVFALAVAAFGLLMMRYGAASAPEIYATAVGEQLTVELADGSTARINTDSLLEVAFARGERRVRVVRGEALFDVEHDPRRPFTVFAGERAARAVGTTFAVRVEGERVDVTVSEGAVALISHVGEEVEGEATPILEAYQTASLIDDGPQIRTLDAQELDRMLSWRDGVLVFDGELLTTVVDEVSRYTQMRLVISDPGLRDLRIGGRFGIGETEALLEALETGFGVRTTRRGETVVVLSARDER